MTPQESSGFTTLDTYRFIVDWALRHKGNTPSQRQIAAGCGFSHATAHYHIQQLIDKGLLERKDGALCIVHAHFSVPNSAFDLLRDRIFPEIESMDFIPKEVRYATKGSSLEKLGVTLGPHVDEEFRGATYPQGWRYVRIDEDKIEKTGVKAWFLRDTQGRDLGVLSFDQNEYRAKLYILE